MAVYRGHPARRTSAADGHRVPEENLIYVQVDPERILGKRERRNCNHHKSQNRRLHPRILASRDPQGDAEQNE